MRRRKKVIQGFALLFAAPLFLATTFVVREKGVEVARWVELDGHDGVTYLDPHERLKDADNETTELQKELQESYLPTPQVTQKVKAQQKPGAEAVRIQKSKDYWVKQREQRQEWGLYEGMTREKVEEIAHYQGVLRSKEYKEPYEPAGNWYRVYEYQFNTENYKHVKRVYFDLISDKVMKITNQNVPR